MEQISKQSDIRPPNAGPWLQSDHPIQDPGYRPATGYLIQTYQQSHTF